MSGFLLLLFKVNLAIGAAIILVSLIRRPLRAQFGAPIAYAIWLLVPIASVASLLPPREVPALAHVASVRAPAAPAPVTGYVPHSTLGTIEQLARHSVVMRSTPMKPLGSSSDSFDISRTLFAAWVLGLLFMAAYLIRVQFRFSAAVRRGQGGPAVLGFFHPRIVTPSGFQEQFTPQEQSAILAHERVHLARQDARINALAAFLRCFCWFNPLIHLGARWFRIDQELACDAITVSGAISRRDYSMALLKSQVMVGVLPFGCNWPGPQHPLVERIALLQRKPPGTARRLAGVSLVMFAATLAGMGAWAAQPPVPAKLVAAKHLINQIALASPPARNPPPSQNAGGSPNPPVADANPIGSGHQVDASKDVRTDKPVFAAPPLSEAAPQPLPKDAAASTTAGASNSPMAALHQSVSETSPAAAVTLNNQPVGPIQPVPHNGSTGLAASAGTGSVTANALPAPSVIEPAAIPNTPSGEGDPNTIVCRAPERIANSDQFGPKVCGPNYEWLKLAMIGKDLGPDGKSLIAKSHGETASALACLLDHVRNGCKQHFVGSATQAAAFWLWWTPEKDIELGALGSSEYSGTQSAGTYITKFLSGRTADVYFVMFGHQNKFFYIVPPGPDGEIHYLHVRDATVEDEIIYRVNSPR